MITFAGTGSLIRFFLRRDRGRLTVWVLVLGLLPFLTANSFATLYPTEEARQGVALTVASNPTLVALFGPLHDSSIGGLTAWRVGTLIAVLGGIMAVQVVIRHTREEEETGRRELLGSTVVGRNAPLTAALAVTIGAALVIGLIQMLGLIGLGEPPAGSAAFGMGLAAVLSVFAGVGAVAAQLTETAAAARGLGIGFVGLAFVLRVAGDGGAIDWLSWLSPIGWFVGMRSFADERWWVFVLWLALTTVLIGVSYLVSARRDVGAGVLATRSGNARAGVALSGPLGLAWRLHRGALYGWTAGLAVLGLIYGGVADGIGGFLEGSPQLAEILESLGGEQGLIDGFFAAALGVLAIVASAYAIRSVLKMLSEERAQRVEPVLATATPRLGWAWSHLLFAIVGPTVMLVIGGAAAGAAYGAVIGDVAAQTWRVLGTALVQMPAVWVLTGVAMTIYGLIPRLAGAIWGILVFFLLLGQLGQILQFPQWSLNLSPFTHIPMYPAEAIQPLPMLLLLAISGGLVVLGLAALRSRDIPAT